MIQLAEKAFRLLSLSFLTVGFLVGVAGADRNGDNEVVTAARELIRNVQDADQANQINSGTYGTALFVVNTDEEIPKAEPLRKQARQALSESGK